MFNLTMRSVGVTTVVRKTQQCFPFIVTKTQQFVLFIVVMKTQQCVLFIVMKTQQCVPFIVVMKTQQCVPLSQKRNNAFSLLLS